MRELRRGTAILVTGTPGTGKTTTSRLLAEALRARHVDSKILLKRKGIDYRYDENRKTRVVSLGRIRSSLSALAKRTHCGLVIDSHFALQTGPLPKVVHVIVLRCDPRALMNRLKGKRWSKPKISENVLAEILDICLWEAVKDYGWNRILEIDTTKRNPRGIVRLVMEDLERRRTRRRPAVDWLSTLRRRGTLAEYLTEDRN